jgi:glycosyltransferase involved in cell wall biosynthesis
MQGVERARHVLGHAAARLIGLDVAFYRAFHADLSGLDDAWSLTRHYMRVGRREGRFANIAAFIDAEQARHGPLPLDFAVASYAALNPDVARACPAPWDQISHYLRHGRIEGRRYAAFDPQLYRDLYHPQADLSPQALAAEHARTKSASGRFANWSELTRAHGLEPGRWIDAFDPYAYRLLSVDWRGPADSRASAINHFLRQGVERLTPIALDLIFEPNHDREVHDRPVSATDVDLYRAWLIEGLPEGRPGSAKSHLLALGLDLTAFPNAFDVEAWRARAEIDRASRWAVLEDLVARGLGGHAPPFHRDSADLDTFAATLAEAFLLRDDPASALTAVDALPRLTERGNLARARALLALKRWAEASDVYRRLDNTHWTSQVAADAALAAAREGDFAQALSALRRGAARFSSAPAWRAAARTVLDLAWASDHNGQARGVAVAIAQCLSPAIPLRLQADRPPVEAREFGDDTPFAAVADRLFGATGLTMSRDTSSRSVRLEVAATALGIPVTDGPDAPLSPTLAKPKPRLLLVNTFFPPDSIGGATAVVRENLKDWRSSGALDAFDVAVVCSDPGGAPGQIRADTALGVAAFRIGVAQDALVDWRHDDPAVGAAFARVLAAVRPDVVHFHSIQRLTASVVEACAMAGVPYVVTLHDGWWLSDWQFFVDGGGEAAIVGQALPEGVSPEASSARLLALSGHLRGAAHLLAVSDWCAQAYRQAGFTQVRTLSNGLPATPPVARSFRREGPLRIGYVGGHARIKGYDLLEAALRRAESADLEVIVVDHRRGSDERQELWGQTPVRIRGPIAAEDINAFYAGIDVLLAPSIAPETYGLAAREALAAGLWVVVSDRGAPASIVRPGCNGFVVDVSDADDLVAALQHLNNAPEAYRRPPRLRVSLERSADQARELVELYQQWFASFIMG